MFDKQTTIADLKCLICKHAKVFTGCYCYCTKKHNRVQMSKQIECKKFERGVNKDEQGATSL